MPRKKTPRSRRSSPSTRRPAAITLDYTIVPYAPLRQKIVSAVTSGVVPDVFPNQPAETIALLAWNDKLARLIRDGVGFRRRISAKPLI
jgi:hypothetical protein